MSSTTNADTVNTSLTYLQHIVTICGHTQIGSLDAFAVDAYRALANHAQRFRRAGRQPRIAKNVGDGQAVRPALQLDQRHVFQQGAFLEAGNEFLPRRGTSARPVEAADDLL